MGCERRSWPTMLCMGLLQASQESQQVCISCNTISPPAAAPGMCISVLMSYQVPALAESGLTMEPLQAWSTLTTLTFQSRSSFPRRGGCVQSVKMPACVWYRWRSSRSKFAIPVCGILQIGPVIEPTESCPVGGPPWQDVEQAKGLHRAAHLHGQAPQAALQPHRHHHQQCCQFGQRGSTVERQVRRPGAGTASAGALSWIRIAASWNLRRSERE